MTADKNQHIFARLMAVTAVFAIVAVVPKINRLNNGLFVPESDAQPKPVAFKDSTNEAVQFLDSCRVDSSSLPCPPDSVRVFAARDSSNAN